MKRSQKKIITLKSKILKYMRYSRGISQETAAVAAGCTAGSIGHYENGRMGISEARLKKLLACYGYSYEVFEEFLNGKPLPLISAKEECRQMIEQISNEENLTTILAILKRFAI